MALNIYTAITLEKTDIFFFKFQFKFQMPISNANLNFRIIAGSLPHKPRNLGIKIPHGYGEIAFCPLGYFNLSHPLGPSIYKNIEM